MKTISVFLASNTNHSNTGMFSVDWAAYAFFTEQFPGYKVNLWLMEKQHLHNYPYDNLLPHANYRQLTRDNLYQALSADMIVYWSDFFHTRHFLEQYMEDYVLHNHALPYEEALTLFHEAFYLEGAEPEVYKKTLIFGNSLMFIEPDDFNDDRYSRNIRKLYANANSIMPRDSVSQTKCKWLLSMHAQQGCDPAWLLRHPTAKQEDKIGFYVGRRNEVSLKDVNTLMNFADNNSLELEWIDWMINNQSWTKRAIQNPRQAYNIAKHRLLAELMPSTYGDITDLHKYKFIVTDTYHLAINALAAGVPVFCIGDGSIIYGKNALDLHDRKKKVLFEMMDNLESYGKLTYKKLDHAMSLNPFENKYVQQTRNIKFNLVANCKEILEGPDACEEKA